MKTKQHILRCTVIQVMDFMVLELIRHGFKLAMENEVVNSIDRILDFKWSMLNVSNMKQGDILLAEESYDAAVDVFYTYAFDLGDDGSYLSILESAEAFYWPVDMIVFHCALLISIGESVNSELVEDHYFKYYNLRGYEVPGKNSYTELLLKLMEDLREDADAVHQLNNKLKTKDKNG